MIRTTLVVLAVVAMACSMTPMYSEKKVVFQEGSINLHPAKTSVTEVEGEEGSGTEFLLPDGSYLTLTGGGAAGNLMIVTNQNDGTSMDAKADAKVDATVDATVTP